MRYGKIPYVDKQVSRIFWGTSQPGMLRGEEADDSFEEMFELGVNALDTARNYQMAEKSIGTWLKHCNRRKDVVILSKCAHHDTQTMEKRVTPECMQEDLAVSLDLLNTDYIDIYILHRDDETKPVGPIVETLNRMYEDKRIGAFGASNWTHERICEANAYAAAHGLVPFSVSSPNFSLARQVEDPWGGNCVSIGGPEGEKARAWYRKEKMPVISYSSIARGFFSGKFRSDDPEEKIRNVLDIHAQKQFFCRDNLGRLARAEKLAREKDASVSQIALAYLFASGIDCYAIISTSSAARMKSNIGALEIELTEADVRYLESGEAK